MIKVVSPERENSWYWEVHTSEGAVVARGLADSRVAAFEQANRAKKMHEDSATQELERAPARSRSQASRKRAPPKGRSSPGYRIGRIADGEAQATTLSDQ